MVMHLNASPQKPSRIILLGGNGFIGQNLSSILMESTGFLNIATGQSSSFESEGQLVVKQFLNKMDTSSDPRTNQMIYRHCDHTNILTTFSSLVLTEIEQGVELYQYRGNLNG